MSFDSILVRLKEAERHEDNKQITGFDSILVRLKEKFSIMIMDTPKEVSIPYRFD